MFLETVNIDNRRLVPKIWLRNHYDFGGSNDSVVIFLNNEWLFNTVWWCCDGTFVQAAALRRRENNRKTPTEKILQPAHVVNQSCSKQASCRDGPGQGQMVGFLSEARVPWTLKRWRKNVRLIGFRDKNASGLIDMDRVHWFWGARSIKSREFECFFLWCSGWWCRMIMSTPDYINPPPSHTRRSRRFSIDFSVTNPPKETSTIQQENYCDWPVSKWGALIGGFVAFPY